MKDSIFRRSLSSFFVALSAMLGIIASLILITIALAFLLSDDKSLSSGVKIRPDAKGHRKELSSSVPVILEINFNGEIGIEDLKADKIEEILLRSREKEFKDNRIKGILLIINSPGGGVNDSNMIHNYIMQYKKLYKVPVYAFVDGLCASGGYYIACAADKIYASDVSIIGSIGVISWPPHFNVKDTMEKVGVESLTLSAGKGKDTLNPFRPWKEGEEKTRQELIDYFYNQFISVVSKARVALTEEKLKDVYGANVFPAPQAVEYGYIDVNNAMPQDALKDLVAAAGIKDDEKYQVVTLQKKSWWKQAVEEKSKIRHEISLPAQASSPASYLYIP